MATKHRKSWIAFIFTFLTIGLGHIYSGRAKKGLVLYAGQFLGYIICMIVIFMYPSVLSIMAFVVLALIYLFYSLMDSIKASRENTSSYKFKKYNRWYYYLGFLLISAFLIQPIIFNSVKSHIIQAYKIPAGSIQPTLLIGDQILAKKSLSLKSGIKRKDIVIFRYPEDPTKEFIKRVVAVGGETIEIKDKKVFINNKRINEPYIINSDKIIYPQSLTTRDNLPPTEVPADSLFVMGDNRDNSHDSRFWGFVKKSAVTGKASIIYWSWDRENSIVRWGRIGQIIN